MNKLSAALTLAAAISAVAPATAGPLEDATALRNQWAEAVNSGNVDRVVALLTNDVLFYGNSAQLFKSREAVRAYLASRPSGLKVQLGEHSVVAIEPNVLLSSGVVEFLPAGRPPESARMTLAMVKIGDKWFIAQSHASPLPKQ